MYRAVFKRLLDILVSGVALVVLSPIMLLTALAVKMEDGGPALFRQKRVGKDEVPFEVMKFRSMPVNTSNVPSARTDQLRITKIGKLIRRTNLDELPQLINIFRGDMSLVGPRPALFAQEELNRMRRENGALGCKPGLSGLAQVNSYDGMPETEKARWDGQYAGNITFANDLRIIFKTFGYLTRRPPVY